MSSVDWENLYEKINQLQTQGSSNEVLIQIKELHAKGIPNHWGWKFADLARRAGDPLVSLKIIKNGNSSSIVTQTDREKLVYAAGLIALGNTKEAQNLLAKIQQPEVHAEGGFYQALSLIRQWDYEKALANLEKYFTEAKPQGYRQLVVRVNIVACLVALGKMSNLEKIIADLHQDLSAANANLLLFNLFEIELQYLILKGASDESLVKFQITKNINNPMASLFVKKWKVISTLETVETKKFCTDLEEVRRLAFSIKHWETLRDLDYYQVKKTGDQLLFNKLFWGTPFPAFRKKLLTLNLVPQEKINLGPLAEMPCGQKVSTEAFKHGSSVEKLFRALLSDLYRPLSLGEVFEQVHQNEFFNPETSPARVQRGLFRLRDWLADKPWGVDVLINKGAFSLQFNEPICILLPTVRDPKIDQLLKVFAHNWFTRSEAEKILILSERSVRRLLNKWQEENLIEVRNSTLKSISYRFKVEQSEDN